MGFKFDDYVHCAMTQWLWLCKIIRTEKHMRGRGAQISKMFLTCKYSSLINVISECTISFILFQWRFYNTMKKKSFANFQYYLLLYSFSDVVVFYNYSQMNIGRLQHSWNSFELNPSLIIILNKISLNSMGRYL